MKNLKLIVPTNFIDFAEKVNAHINMQRNTSINYIIKPNLIRFNNGEGKCVLDESIRGSDSFILTDVTNYSITYKCQAGINHMMPDEHFQDIIRMISSTCGHADTIRVIMPYLYQSRQDKRNGRESLDLAISLNQLRYMGVKEIITADVHNKPACDNASCKMPVDNFYCSDDILLELIKDESINFDNLMIVAPDRGAVARANFYSTILGNVPLGFFEKQRDYGQIVDGKNPITQHKFLSTTSLQGMDVIVVDDMIASGGSILDTAKQLKERGANKVFLVCTFGLFTNGSKVFDLFYEKKIINRVYVTNLNYIPLEIKNKEWISIVDCSEKVASLICKINDNQSIERLLNSNEATLNKIKKLKK